MTVEAAGGSHAELRVNWATTADDGSGTDADVNIGDRHLGRDTDPELSPLANGEGPVGSNPATN